MKKTTSAKKSDLQSVDDFLEEESKSGMLAVLEPASRSGYVEITPWSSGGCACGESFELPRAVILGVRRTGQRHLCCGKLLSLVEVTFVETHDHVLRAVFASRQKSSSQARALSSPAGYGGGDPCVECYHRCAGMHGPQRAACYKACNEMCA